MEQETNGRLTEIEIKLSYLEDFMNKIQKITVEHTETIDRLKAENRALKAKLSELIESQEDEIPNQKPPHY
ncbi:MAG: SlyX family protein [Spirochaetaceae bacterium]|nr:SlyX family protein [Spirochaetaceae bacterium]MBR4824734.1 SlyX family protein [Spirochaetaceae bacterium]